jgi:hypothetical protein
MESQKQLWYEPHPVTPERKKALLAAHYKIVDARYAPPGWVRPGADIALTPTGVVLTDADAAADLKGEPRPDNHGRSSWAENAPPVYMVPTVNFVETPTSAELRAKLDAAGIEYQKHAPKAKLLELASGL